MLCNILLLFVCMPIIKYLLSVPTERQNNETVPNFATFFRKFEMPPPPMQKVKTKSRPETYYEPYWSNGDWVFYRKESTRRPQPFFLNEGNTTQHDECNEICPEFIQDYGYVCGMLYNKTSTKYELRTFQDYCYLQLENCYYASKNWFPVYKGNCTETMTTQPFAHIFFVTKAATYEAVFNNT